jgi:putative membrane protein
MAFLWAFGGERRERIGHAFQAPAVVSTWRAITGPLTVWALHGVALWVWHIPSLYEAALRNDGIHAVQHLCFFVTAGLFWWALVHGRFGRAGYGVAVFYVFTTALHSSILGALMTFAPRLWYPLYEARTLRWHLSPLEDQQLAGLLMWVPAGVIFLILGLALFAAWMGAMERRVALTRSETLASQSAGGENE